ncbi:MAG: LysR family transcriptional regulator, partial [Acidaminococcaceae bacterium]|nr:LysR family transcriptional regulator [Acidaminococcaceae bacterium]
YYYGAKLIQTARGKRQLTLTEAGEAFLNKARQICRTEETLLLDMQSFTKKASGTLRFSVSPAKSTFFINTYLRPFAATYPEISFQFREEAVSAQTRHIAENSSDFAFANAPLPSPQLFAAHKTQKEYFYAVYSQQADYGLDPRQTLTPQQLQNIPVCCNFGCYSLLRKACLKHGFTPKIRFIATTNTAALAFVQDGSGVAIVSAGGRDDFPTGLVSQRLDDDELYFEQTLFWSKKDRLSNTAQLFLDFYLARQGEKGK